MYRMISFYIPLGASAILASLTHIIISSVLARSSEPEATISGYAIALGLAFILEQTLGLLRQTSAKFVRDQRSFREMRKMVAWIVGILLAINILVAWTPIGMIVRLVVMGLLSWAMIAFGWTDDSRYGAVLFLSVWRSRRGSLGMKGAR